MNASLRLAWISMLLGAAVVAGCASTQSTSNDSEPLGWTDAPMDVVSAEVEGDSLVTVVRYGGGCGEHRFFLEPAGPLMKSLPPKQPLRWVHRSSGDPCRALILDTVRADLKPFRGSPHGSTVLLLEGWNEDLIYTYR